MSSLFVEKSKEIADKFIQSVLFVDDEIYSDKGDQNHNLDAKELVRVFSKAKKLCALNNPRNESDFTDVIEVAKKADVSVLDWKMDLPGSEDEDIDEEVDVDEDDPRGTFTLRLIDEILSDKEATDTFKLILIYTGEVILTEIVDKIGSHFERYGLQQISENTIGKQNIKIIVAGKPTLEGRLNHAKELKKWIIDYPEIPEFLLNEFAKMTEGLISNFVLRSLTIIRENTFQLVRLFGNELDAAFLLHRILLPRQEDSGEHLIEIFTHSIQALLYYNDAEKPVDAEDLKKWLLTKEFSNEIKIAKKDFTVDQDFIKDCLDSGFVQAIEKRWDGEISASKKQDIVKEFNKLYLNYPNIFNSEEEKHSNEKFSILTHHKSNLKLPSKVPILSLGALIKEKDKSKYFICIQAKCDSVRVNSERKFLFLPLEPVTEGSKFHFIVEEDKFVRLRIAKEVFELRTIKFLPDSDTQTVLAVKHEGSFVFNSIYGEVFEWLADLKDAHAQRVANNFASYVSRVGLDESEWLRRWSS